VHYTESPWSVLIVENDQQETARLQEHLARPPMGGVVVDAVGTLAAALRRAATRDYDAVLVSLGLPDSCGLYTFDAVSAAAPRAAIIVLTERDEAQVAAEAVRRGAQDHLIRCDRRTGVIASTVLHAIRRQHVLAELRAARDAQLAEKDRFLAHVSHELRSPLSVVQQFAGLLADGSAGPVSDDQATLLDALARNAGQLAGMIDELLQVVRARRGTLPIEAAVLDPVAEVADVLAGFRPVAVQRRIALVFEPAPVPNVIADAGRLREIVRNVIDNALKFTTSGGRVCVSIATAEGMVRFAVRDTGAGIAAADLPHVFETFYQGEQRPAGRRRGLGLGLAICRDLVERQGGTITAESEVGDGTLVSFTLPVARAGRGGACRVAAAPMSLAD
jgi:signal transduction histidine kinase